MLLQCQDITYSPTQASAYLKPVLPCLAAMHRPGEFAKRQELRLYCVGMQGSDVAGITGNWGE